eukprot:SAG31_NODE_10744_length_1103_cov_1.449203_1_plen_103_part_10
MQRSPVIAKLIAKIHNWSADTVAIQNFLPCTSITTSVNLGLRLRLGLRLEIICNNFTKSTCTITVPLVATGLAELLLAAVPGLNQFVTVFVSVRVFAIVVSLS